jgi:hypothetical protein
MVLFGPARSLEPGEWRLTCWRSPACRFARRIQRYPEGTVYQIWMPWVGVKLMVARSA